MTPACPGGVQNPYPMAWPHNRPVDWYTPGGIPLGCILGHDSYSNRLHNVHLCAHPPACLPPACPTCSPARATSTHTAALTSSPIQLTSAHTSSANLLLTLCPTRSHTSALRTPVTRAGQPGPAAHYRPDTGHVAGTGATTTRNGPR